MFLVSELTSASWTRRSVDTCEWDISTMDIPTVKETYPNVIKNMPDQLLANIYNHPLAKSSLSLGLYKRFEDGSDLFTLYETSGKKLITGRRFIGNADQCSATIETTDLIRFISSQYGENGVMQAVRMWLYTATLS